MHRFPTNTKKLTGQWVILLGAIVAILCCAPHSARCVDVDVTADIAPDAGRPLAMLTAEDYLSNVGYWWSCNNDSFLSYAAGSKDTGFNNVLSGPPAASYHGAGIADSEWDSPMGASARSAGLYSKVLHLDSGGMSAPNAFALRVMNDMGQISVVRVAWTPTPSPPPGSTVVPGGNLGSPTAITAASGAVRPASTDTGLTYLNWPDMAQIAHFFNEVGATRRLRTTVGRGNFLEVSARPGAHGDLMRLGSQWPAQMGIAFHHGNTLSMVIDPNPLIDNQSVERLYIMVGGPQSRSRLTLRNMVWRRTGLDTGASWPAVGASDSSGSMSGNAWVLSDAYSAGSRLSISTAISRWNESADVNVDPAGSVGTAISGLTEMVTGELMVGRDQAFGLGLCRETSKITAQGSVSPTGTLMYPFASYACSLRHVGRLFVSAGAPLDYQTRVPVALRWTTGW